MTIGVDNFEMSLEDEDSEGEGEKRDLEEGKEDFDFSGSSIVKEMNGRRPCPKFVVFD